MNAGSNGDLHVCVYQYSSSKLHAMSKSNFLKKNLAVEQENKVSLANQKFWDIKKQKADRIYGKITLKEIIAQNAYRRLLWR